MSSSAIPVGHAAVSARPSLRIAAPSVVPGRLALIDATRGIAMLFVFLAHFADIVVVQPSTRSYRQQLEHVGMIASPLFIIVSGTILGLLYVSRAEDFPGIRYRMIDRSLLLLTIGHALIAVANMPLLVHSSDAWRMIFITDTIAVCALAGSTLIRVVPARHRIGLGAALYALSWTLVICWHPVDTQTGAIKDFIVGPYPDSRWWVYVVPVLPWFSVYFASSTLGEYLARSSRGNASRDFGRKLVRFGIAAIGVGCAMKLGYLVLLKVRLLSGATEVQIAHLLTGPFAKIPPSPDYLAVYGGAGLTLMGLLLRYGARPELARAVSWLALIGRNSLFVFIVQYYVYFVLLHAIRRPPMFAWPMLFAASVLGIVATAWWWDRRNGNRFLTVGVVWFVRYTDSRFSRASSGATA